MTAPITTTQARDAISLLCDGLCTDHSARTTEDTLRLQQAAETARRFVEQHSRTPLLEALDRMSPAERAQFAATVPMVPAGVTISHLAPSLTAVERQVVEAAVDWASDTGSCHFCAFSKEREGFDGGVAFTLPDEPHDEDCPVGQLLAARARTGDTEPAPAQVQP